MSDTRRRFSVTACLCALLLSMTTGAGATTPWWAWGEVEFVQQNVGMVVIGLTTTALDGCTADRVYLRDSLLGEKHVDRAFSMALAAQASGRQIGIVIDLDVRNAGGECRALGNMLVKD